MTMRQPRMTTTATRSATTRRPRGRGSALFLVAVTAISLAMGRRATAQLPCHYDVTIVPNLSCPVFGDGPGTPIAINNLGHVVLTATGCLQNYTDSYIWTGGAGAPTLIPRDAGMYSFTATDLNDSDKVCGEAWYTGMGLRAVIYDTHTGVWTVLPPLNPPDGWSSASAINNNNVVCGYRSIGGPNGPVNPQTGYLWSGDFTDLGLINSQSTSAADINQQGVTAVQVKVKGIKRAAIWNRGSLTILPTLDGMDTSPAAINSQQWVVGRARFPFSGPPGQTNHAFLWSNGIMRDLGILTGDDLTIAEDINDSNTVVGVSRRFSPTRDRGFAWQAGALRELGSLIEDGITAVLDASAIAADGRIVASVRDAQGHIRAAVLTPVLHAGDAHPDCQVNVDDLLAVIVAWGATESPADLNNDAHVNIDDLLEVIVHWGN